MEEIAPFQLYIILLVYNYCVLHLNHQQPPLYSSSFIQFLQALQNGLIRYVHKVLLPSQLVTGETAIPSSLPYTTLQLCTCVLLCTSQLLENEESLRKRLSLFIHRWVQSYQGSNTSHPIPSNPSIFVFDGCTNGLKEMKICLQDYKRNNVQPVSYASFSDADLLLLLLTFQPTLLYPSSLSFT